MSESVIETHAHLVPEKWIEEAIYKHFHKLDTIVQECVIQPFNGTEGGLSSKMYDVRLRTSSSSSFDVKGTKNHTLVVKILPTGKAKDHMNLSDQFKNEGLFFTKILPFFLTGLQSGDAFIDSKSITNLFPKCVLIHEDSFQSMIGLENLAPLGFRLTDKTLDLKHILLALKSLGRFHACSYAWKKKYPKSFNKIISEVKKPRDIGAFGITFSGIVNFGACYPIEMYKERYPEKYDRHLVRIEKIRESFTDASKTFYKLFEPEEPTAVLCHGDFNRNNLLFRYDKHGDPCDIKIIDFQLMYYSCPSIDIALLLFLNTTYKVRSQHWNDLFRCYHESLLENLAQILKCHKNDLLKEYSMEHFENDFTKRALTGYFVAAFFLPVTFMKPEIYSEVSKSITEEEDMMNLEKFINRLKQIRKYIGEDEKERLADLFKEFLEKNYV